MKKINLGCGRDVREGWINIDIQDFGQEIVRDIIRGLPFDDNSIDEIFASHFVEHIEREDVKFVWEEIYRILKVDGIFEMTCPHSFSEEAFFMTHLSYWNEKVILTLCNQWPGGSYTKTDFEILENTKIGFELHVKLRKIK